MKWTLFLKGPLIRLLSFISCLRAPFWLFPIYLAGHKTLKVAKQDPNWSAKKTLHVVRAHANFATPIIIISLAGKLFCILHIAAVGSWKLVCNDLKEFLHFWVGQGRLPKVYNFGICYLFLYLASLEMSIGFPNNYQPTPVC